MRDGNIELGGGLPINTHGGQLGEAYLHGMNGIAEGVRQVRGTSVNQVPDVDHVLVTAGTGVPTSGLILGRRPLSRARAASGCERHPAVSTRHGAVRRPAQRSATARSSASASAASNGR